MESANDRASSGLTRSRGFFVVPEGSFQPPKICGNTIIVQPCLITSFTFGSKSTPPQSKLIDKTNLYIIIL